MSTNRSSRTRPSLAVIAAVVATVMWLNAGSLTPSPGPIAPTMKTLAEVEPRIAINHINTPGDEHSQFRITQSGSYYLPGNLTGQSDKHGIVIASGNVTIDLMGHSYRGARFGSASLTGIIADDVYDNIIIRNGVVRNWGEDGILLFSRGVFVTGVHVSHNGGGGVLGSLYGIIRECTATSNKGAGLSTFGGSLVESCTAQLNGEAGIVAGSGSIVRSSTSSENSGPGILAGGCLVERCVVMGNDSDGIRVTSGCHVVGNLCLDSGGAGIRSEGPGNRCEGNTVYGNDSGVRTEGRKNLVVRNLAISNEDVPFGGLPEFPPLPSDPGLVGEVVRSRSQMQNIENALVNYQIPED